MEHQAQKLDILLWLGALVVSGMLVQSCLFAYAWNSGPSVAVLNNGLLLLLIGGLKIVRCKTSSTRFNEYIVILILLVPIFLSILVNTNSLPDRLNGPGIDDFRAHYKRYFYMVAVLQIIDIKKAVVLCGPLYLIAQYFYIYWLK